MGLNKYIHKAQFGKGFEIEKVNANHIKSQCQSSPKLIGILTMLRCIFGPNAELLTSIQCGVYDMDKPKLG